MPVLRITIEEIVEALATKFCQDRRALVRIEPEELVQKLSTSYPPLHTVQAEALGLRSDGDIATLIQKAMAG